MKTKKLMTLNQTQILLLELLQLLLLLPLMVLVLSLRVLAKTKAAAGPAASVSISFSFSFSFFIDIFRFPFLIFIFHFDFDFLIYFCHRWYHSPVQDSENLSLQGQPNFTNKNSPLTNRKSALPVYSNWVILWGVVSESRI